MSFDAPPVPAPQNEHAKRTNELFVVFYEELGKWPWEVIDFGPRRWGQNLVHDFTRLLSVDLPKTKNVSHAELIEYLHHNSVDHPKVQYQYQLNMMLIAKATKWLAEKRELADPDPDSDTDSDGSILNEPQNVTRNRKQARALRAATRTAPVRSARKRPINYSDRHHFQLHNVDDTEDDGAGDADEDGRNEETQEEAELESAEPAAKRRLMVFFNFSPENTHELSKLMGDVTTAGARHSIPQRNAAGGSPLLDTPNQSLNEVQIAYADHLKREIAKVEENITRTEANINNSSRRRTGYQETARNSAAALEKATREATEASKEVQKARALCEADAQVVEELRRLSSDNPTILTEESFRNIKENTPAQKKKREAENALRTKERRLNNVKTKIQIAEANMDPLSSKISELSDVLKAKKNVRRSIIAMHRLVTMGGEEMEGVLGEKGLEEWLGQQQI
ncbi:hypothetical protein FMEXI_10141 [Fusarium mexicanum]|uniref:Uncharacterized protein n=1 Tax=Fusarium mexicanum TaxID=751941 RepID=A0A8H5IJG0_9HYPO|nr:hypothetical protein FMEXI_10141 [Fusarium mexicanum]